MVLTAGEQAFHKMILPVLTMRLQYEFYHKPLILLQLILSEVSTGDKLFYFVCVSKVWSMQYTVYKGKCLLCNCGTVYFSYKNIYSHYYPCGYF